MNSRQNVPGDAQSTAGATAPADATTATPKRPARQGTPAKPLGTRRINPRKVVLPDAGEPDVIAYMAVQGESPWEPRNEKEIGKRGAGAVRVLLSPVARPGFRLGATVTLHHPKSGAWVGDWEITGIAKRARNGTSISVQGDVPDQGFVGWLLEDKPARPEPKPEPDGEADDLDDDADDAEDSELVTA
jgi:hypothetical protein